MGVTTTPSDPALPGTGPLPRTANGFISSLVSCLLLSTVSLFPASGMGATPAQTDLTEIPLEALMDIEVTSVAKKPQKKSEAAAAIFVITNEDLRRWGVTSIPDALRRVPGLQVARIDANKWAITARGFNSRFANKLLVLIDGRSIYTPLFAGVYWEANDVMLEDVERIEVIRGPGGTLWGANAVNGVINIITRSAADTRGTLVAGSAGKEENGYIGLRHGGTTSSNLHYRVYGKFHSTDEGGAVQTWFPTTAHDDGESGQAGFRMDWQQGQGNQLTLQGDIHDGHADQQLLLASSVNPVIDNARYNGGNLLSRWTHRSGADSGFTLQAYLDHAGLDSAILYENRDTLDIDFQQQWSPRDAHSMMWGVNFRTIHDNTESRPDFSLMPANRSVQLYTAFIQDEIHLIDDRARLTIGSKFEHNAFTGFEAQPNVRITWLTDTGATIWGAVSRAVRTPARGEQNVNLAIPTQSGILTILGDRNYHSEQLISSELGYRFRPATHLSVDLTAFLNHYENLRTVDMTPTPGVATFSNNLQGEAHGIEVDARWDPFSRLSVNVNYSYLDLDLELRNGSADSISQSAEKASPRHQANIWIAANLDNRIELDTGLRYVDSIRTAGMTFDTPAYLALDARIGWQPRRGLELSLVGQNLLDGKHPEFNPDFIFSLPTEVERSIFGKVTVKF